jgi:hypothetical protein
VPTHAMVLRLAQPWDTPSTDPRYSMRPSMGRPSKPVGRWGGRVRCQVVEASPLPSVAKPQTMFAASSAHTHANTGLQVALARHQQDGTPRSGCDATPRQEYSSRRSASGDSCYAHSAQSGKGRGASHVLADSTLKVSEYQSSVSTELCGVQDAGRASLPFPLLWLQREELAHTEAQSPMSRTALDPGKHEQRNDGQSH